MGKPPAIGRARVAIATVITYCAMLIAPREIRAAFKAYCMLLETLPMQINNGRRWGTISIPWCIGREGADYANAQATIAQAAALEFRASVEVKP